MPRPPALQATGHAAFAWAFAALALASFLYVGYIEVGPRVDMPVQIDELYFLICAIRHEATGQFASSGCTDNKPPLIYVLYGVLLRLWSGSSFDLLPVKVAGVAVALGAAALAGAVARRLAGPAAGAFSAALLLLVFAHDPVQYALKTEILGSLFMLGMLGVLAGGVAPPAMGRGLAAGVLGGLALMSKQTFVFPVAALVLAAAFLVVRQAVMGGLWHRALGGLAGLSLGVLLPMAALIGAHAVAGTWVDLLASLFIYPALYGAPSADPWLKTVVLRIAAALRGLAEFWWVVYPMVGWWAWLVTARSRDDDPTRSPSPYIWVAAALAGGLLGILLTPFLFKYHLSPFLTLAAVPAGCLLATVSEGLRGRGAPEAALRVAWMTVGVAALASSWSGSAGDPLRDRRELPSAHMDLGTARVGYVVGMWPKFYVDNRLVPASDVMYPTALPGMPDMWSFRQPPAGSRPARMLDWVHPDNLRRLQADFDRTPPELIVVVDGHGKGAGSPRPHSDIQFLDQYIGAHCEPAGRTTPETNYRNGDLYRCRKP